MTITKRTSNRTAIVNDHNTTGVIITLVEGKINMIQRHGNSVKETHNVSLSVARKAINAVKMTD